MKFPGPWTSVLFVLAATLPSPASESNPAAIPTGAVTLQMTPVVTTRLERRGDVLFADFGKAAFGNLEIEFLHAPPAAQVTVREVAMRRAIRSGVRISPPRIATSMCSAARSTRRSLKRTSSAISG